jgi:WD40 repeat protein
LTGSGRPGQYRQREHGDPSPARIPTASDIGTVWIWDTDGTLRSALNSHDDLVDAVAIAPDGTWLATGGIDGTALYRFRTRRRRCDLLFAG